MQEIDTDRHLEPPLDTDSQRLCDAVEGSQRFPTAELHCEPADTGELSIWLTLDLYICSKSLCERGVVGDILDELQAYVDQCRKNLEGK